MPERLKRVNPDEDPVVVEILAELLGERRTRLTDRRLLIIFLLLVVLLGVCGTYVVQTRREFHRFEQSTVGNCLGVRANTIRLNEFIGKLQVTVLTSPGRTVAERKALVEQYQEAKQGVPRCPPSKAHVIRIDPPPPAPTAVPSPLESPKG